MSTDANQIELLVREVLARLAHTSLPGSATHAQSPAIETIKTTAPASDELELMTHVISAKLLDGKLTGIKTVRVRSQAVVTPAARDLLRAANVKLVRGSVQKSQAGPNTTAAVDRPVALALFCQPASLVVLKKQLCPRRALVAAASKNIEEVVHQVRQALSAGHRLGVVVAENSFELNMALGQSGLKALRVANWGDFKLALGEAKPNVWLFDSRQWNVPATTNACNQIYDSGYWRSLMESR